MGLLWFKIKVTTKVWNVSECLSRWYFLNHRTFCYQIWYSDVTSWARVSCETFFLCLLSSRSRSQQGIIWPKYDSFYYIFWTVDSLTTKLWLMIHHHELECPMKKVGLLHSESRSQQRIKMLMFVQMISSKPPSILFPNFVLWCIIMQELLWSKYDSVCCIFWIADSFAAKLCLIVHYHKPECFMDKLDCCVEGQGHSKISNGTSS